jgi:hypothetical protein
VAGDISLRRSSPIEGCRSDDDDDDNNNHLNDMNFEKKVTKYEMNVFIFFSKHIILQSIQIDTIIKVHTFS